MKKVFLLKKAQCAQALILKLSNWLHTESNGILFDFFRKVTFWKLPFPQKNLWLLYTTVMYFSEFSLDKELLGNISCSKSICLVLPTEKDRIVIILVINTYCLWKMFLNKSATWGQKEHIMSSNPTNVYASSEERGDKCRSVCFTLQNDQKTESPRSWSQQQLIETIKQSHTQLLFVLLPEKVAFSTLQGPKAHEMY